MDGLVSRLFRGDARLAQCLTQDSAHVTTGSRGPFVAKIQYAVLVLQGGRISARETSQQQYGPDTARCVLAYKTQRKIINPAYQKTADNIVGKMTIRALDDEMVLFEARETLQAIKPRLLQSLKR